MLWEGLSPDADPRRGPIAAEAAPTKGGAVVLWEGL